jgi:hemolysin activation/secretion protein
MTPASCRVGPGTSASRRSGLTHVGRIVIGLLLLAATLGTSPASAQTSPRGVPTDRPDQLRTAAPARHATPVVVKARNPLAPVRPFDLTRVFVTGSTLADDRLAQTYRPFLNRTVDGRALVAITTALAAAYDRSDIALYTIYVPEQDFAGGAVHLAVIEGHVSKVEIRGKVRKSRLRLIQAYLRRVEREEPLRTSTLQRALSLVRDMPGMVVTPALEPTDAQGGVALVLTVGERRLHIVAGINDRGTALLGRTQVQADMLVNGVFAGADQVKATLVLPTHLSRFRYLAGAYSAPLDGDGTTITATLSNLRTHPALIPLDGKATAFGLQVSRALVRRYDRNLSVTIGLDGIDTNNALLGFTLSNDRVRALRLASAYTITTKRNQLTLSATASLGLNILGARVVPGQSRQDFGKIDARLADTWQIAKGFELRLNAFVQATRDDLPSSEQIALGGDEFGRAYEAALIAGDDGYAGSAECAWIPATIVPAGLKGSELYVYADGGHVTYRSRPGFDGAATHLASVGGGVRLHVAGKTVVQLEGVRGLSNPVAYEDREKARVLFSIKSLF